MKYVISWRERPAASAKDYETAQERVLQIFNKDWKMPASFTMHQFVVRVGDYGGYMVVESQVGRGTSFFVRLPVGYFPAKQLKAAPEVHEKDPGS